jgi:hypothetical protein
LSLVDEHRLPEGNPFLLDVRSLDPLDVDLSTFASSRDMPLRDPETGPPRSPGNVDKWGLELMDETSIRDWRERTRAQASVIFSTDP